MSWLQNTFRGLLFKNVAFNLTIQVLNVAVFYFIDFIHFIVNLEGHNMRATSLGLWPIPCSTSDSSDVEKILKLIML